MKTRNVILFLLVISWAIFPTHARAKGWYLGGEFQLTSPGDGIVEEIENGYGFGLDFGYRFSPRFALDFIWGISFHDEEGNDVEYMRFIGGGRLILNHTNRLQPYITAGLESHLIFRSLFDDMDGSGFFVGFGGDYYISERGSLDICFRHSMWTGEVDTPRTSEDVTTDTLSVSYKHHFSK